MSSTVARARASACRPKLVTCPCRAARSGIVHHRRDRRPESLDDGFHRARRSDHGGRIEIQEVLADFARQKLQGSGGGGPGNVRHRQGGDSSGAEGDPREGVGAAVVGAADHLETGRPGRSVAGDPAPG